MTLVMTSLMTFKMTQKTKLYTDKELSFERVFEIRIVDLRKRQGIKQKSFSISIKKGTKDNEYIETEKLKDMLEKAINEVQ